MCFFSGLLWVKVWVFLEDISSPDGNDIYGEAAAVLVMRRVSIETKVSILQRESGQKEKPVWLLKRV